jgi:hypothetical protein
MHLEYARKSACGDGGLLEEPHPVIAVAIPMTARPVGMCRIRLPIRSDTKLQAVLARRG